MTPKLTEHQRHEYLGNQKGLDQREGAKVQRYRLENQRAEQGHPTQPPQGLAKYRASKGRPTGRTLLSLTSNVLGGDRGGVGECGQGGKANGPRGGQVRE